MSFYAHIYRLLIIATKLCSIFGAMSGLEILGVPAFAIALADAVAKSYHLVERYKEAEPRARQLLSELQLTADLLAQLQRQLSDNEAVQGISPSLHHSLNAWISRCHTTQLAIETRLSPSPSDRFTRGKKIKLAAADDLFASLERRVNGDRALLNSTLGLLHWYVQTAP